VPEQAEEDEHKVKGKEGGNRETEREREKTIVQVNGLKL
jgi:hypothetical protein